MQLIKYMSHIMFIGYYADQHNYPFHMSPYFGYAERLLASSGLKIYLCQNGDVYGSIETLFTRTCRYAETHLSSG